MWVLTQHGLFSALYHRTLNVGRVVSPTLAMIVQREAEIKVFKSEPFYKVSLDFGGFKAESERFPDKAEASELAQACNRDEAVIKISGAHRKERESPGALRPYNASKRC